MTPTIESLFEIKVQVTVTQQDPGRDMSVELQKAELPVQKEPRETTSNYLPQPKYLTHHAPALSQTCIPYSPSRFSLPPSLRNPSPAIASYDSYSSIQDVSHRNLLRPPHCYS